MAERKQWWMISNIYFGSIKWLTLKYFNFLYYKIISQALYMLKTRVTDVKEKDIGYWTETVVNN